MKHKKTSESEILATKWHNSAPHNDAEKLTEKGIRSPNLDGMYAKAYHAGYKIWKYFTTPERLKKFIANPFSQEWEIYINQNNSYEKVN